MAAQTIVASLSLPSSDISSCMATKKRKTPSELRVEQLKRVKPLCEDVFKASSDRSFSLLATSQKPESSKPLRLIEMRVPDIYAAAKPSDRPKLFSIKNKQKDACILYNSQLRDKPLECTVNSTSVDSKHAVYFGCEKLEEGVTQDATTSSRENFPEMQRMDIGSKNEVDHNSRFRNVTEISTNASVPLAGVNIDMAKALRSMLSVKTPNTLDPHYIQPPKSAPNKLSSLHIQTDKVPLDLSLKTSMRLVSSTSFHWCHHLNMEDGIRGLQKFIALGCHETHIENTNAHSCDEKKRCNFRHSFWKSLHSWVYPQSSLPPSVLSALAVSAVRGGSLEKSFLSQRQQAWEDSFRSLYYMFRNKLCKLFYVELQQFIVMFIGGVGGRHPNTCSAYLTRSTRGLRGLLQEQDVTFTMPFCGNQPGEMTMEELQELTDFEKENPGQTRLVDSIAAVDNSPQSLLAFEGNKSVHGLYDFLLNHRLLLASTAAVDFPVLYSYVPFQNSALTTPDVSCKQIKRADSDSIDSMSYSLEIKGSILPPWVVSGICLAIPGSQEGSFEATFTTDPLSEGLNICQGVDDVNNLKFSDTTNTVGYCEADFISHSVGLKEGVLKHLKYSKGSYTASLS